MFIDMHCHILPHIDDGADSSLDALEIISGAQRTGTKIMVVTPHYNYPEKIRHNISKSELTEKYKEFIAEINKHVNGMKFFLGSELLANEKITEIYRDNEFISVNGSRYILTEFYFNENVRNVYTYIEKLCSFGFTPIIAHPERYSFMQEQHFIENLLNKGCKIQANKGSLLGHYGTKAKDNALKLLYNDYIHIIASDCHNPTSRNADMSELYVKMLEKFPQSKINKLFHDNPKRVLLDIEL